MKLELNAENIKLLNFICQEAGNYKIEALKKLKMEVSTEANLNEEKFFKLPQIVWELKAICEFWQLVIAFEPDVEIRKQLYENTNLWIGHCDELFDIAENFN